MSEVSNHTAGENGLGILKNDKQKLEIVIGATFTGEPIIDSLSFIMKRFNPDHTCRLAPYNQIIQQLLDFNSLMNQNSGINILLIRLEDWLRTKRTGEEQSEIIESSLAEKLEQNATSLVEALKAAISNSRAAFFVYFCPGSTTITCNQKNNDLLLECEKKLTGQLNTLTGVYPVMSGEIFHYYRVEKYYDSHADKLGHIPYTPEFFTALGLMLVRKIFALKRKIYKVIVLDCDET
jgi:predicted enzyme involved in methoxymalonyl-ACP biosynthesis